MRNKEKISSIRNFNRFYTNVISILDSSILASNFSLAEARILYEIEHTPHCTASNILNRLTIDEGYLSRILAKFVRRKWTLKIRLEEDKRSYQLILTKAGKEQLLKLEQLANESTQSIINNLTHSQVKKLVESMNKIQELLTPKYAN